MDVRDDPAERAVVAISSVSRRFHYIGRL